MKYAEIMEVRDALVRLGEKDLPVAYEVAKNIRICNSILNETREILQDLHKKFADKDKDGNIIQYEENGQQVSKITDKEKLAQYQEELRKLDAEEHEVAFLKVSKASFAGKDVPGLVLVPLVDVVITD